MFVEEYAWIDEAMVWLPHVQVVELQLGRTTDVSHLQYQQIFAISQALPGSASVKMLYCINAVHGGHGAGVLATAFFRYVWAGFVHTFSCVLLMLSVPASPEQLVCMDCPLAFPALGTLFPDPSTPSSAA